MAHQKVIPFIALLLTSAPVLSRAEPTPSPLGCPPAPTATMAPIRSPAERQAQLASGLPTGIPPNAHLRIPSLVGPPATVELVLRENGVPVPFERQVDDATIEIVPRRPLRAGSRLTLDVGGIRSGNYRIDAIPDVRAPELGAVHVDAVEVRSQSKIVCPPPGPPTDRVRGTIKIHEDSTMRLRGRVVVKEVVIATATHPIATPVNVSSGISDERWFVFSYPPGTLPSGTRVTLRIDAVDIAGNVSATLDVPIDVPDMPDMPDREDAGVPTEAAPASSGRASSGRGCGR